MALATFNIQNAIQKLVSSAHLTSQHECAKYVRIAMEAGGLSTNGRPSWAWQYLNWLPTQGWTPIAKLSTKAEQMSFNAQPGDVAVYQKPGVGSSEPGHICMWSGKNWISDFVQNNMNVYRSDATIVVFRYNSTTDPAIDFNDFNSSFQNNNYTAYSGNGGGTISGFNTPNTVYRLASTGERNDVIKLDDSRKSEFESLRNSLKSEVVDMGRDIIESPELYNSSILKTSQTAKQQRKFVKTKTGDS